MKKFITEKHQQACIHALEQLVAIPSVLNEGEEQTPFGKDIQNCLETCLNICEDLGFTTYVDPKGYYGYAEVGSGEELLAILCHLDVVPAGDMSKWQTPPFTLVQQDGYLYGRGTQDDKGPSMAAVYAVKALMDAGVEFNKRVRFIFGTDEETLWRCLARYNQLEEPATMGFAPDAEFPLTYAEKGLLQCVLKGIGSKDVFLKSGDAFNVVPGKASYTGKYRQEVMEYLIRHQVPYQLAGETVTVLGVSKHAKDAASGVNAIVWLAKALSSVVSHPTLDFIAHEVGEDATASQLFGNRSDEVSGDLSFNIAALMIDPDHSEIKLDIRIPVLTDKLQLVQQLQEKIQKYQLKYEEFDYLEALYVPLESTLVNTLMSVYREKTGDHLSQPQSSGGATFARTMKNCVAYGAVFPNSPITFHMENEKIALVDLFRAMDIYAEAIYRLATQKMES